MKETKESFESSYCTCLSKRRGGEIIDLHSTCKRIWTKMSMNDGDWTVYCRKVQYMNKSDALRAARKDRQIGGSGNLLNSKLLILLKHKTQICTVLKWRVKFQFRSKVLDFVLCLIYLLFWICSNQCAVKIQSKNWNPTDLTLYEKPVVKKDLIHQAVPVDFQQLQTGQSAYAACNWKTPCISSTYKNFSNVE